MFLLIGTYMRPLDEVDAALETHREWLGRYVDSGHILLAGRREPAVGGALVVRAASRAEVDAMVADDPYVQGGLAEYEVVEFTPRRVAPGLDWAANPPSG
jgi:uncharacterized protein YciI